MPDELDEHWYPAENASLADLVDRLLGSGVVIAGDITLAIADIDLVHISLRALLSSVGTLLPQDPEVEVLSSGELLNSRQVPGSGEKA